MSTPDNQPTIRAVSWRDGYGREQHLVPKAELDAALSERSQWQSEAETTAAELVRARERIRELTIDRDETERERVKALDRELYAAGRLQQLRESPELRLAIAHRDDCMKYEGIIEASMASLGVEKYGELPDAARNARLVAEWLIAEVRYRYSHFYDRMRADLDGISPEATRPAHLRFAATIIEQTIVPKCHGGKGEDQGRTARQLRDEADRIEGERPSPDEQLVAGVAEICESSVRTLLTALGVTHVSNIDPSVVDWRSTAEEALSAAGLLRGGDAT